MAPYYHSQRTADAARCPNLTGSVTERARRADKDATDFVVAIREEEPRVFWGRVARFAENDPQGFMAAFVHLAAMVDLDDTIAPWTRQWGGTAALHPDYHTPAPPVPPQSRTPEIDQQIIALARDSGLLDSEIATRLGVAQYYVDRVRRDAGILRRPGRREAPARCEAILRLLDEGLSRKEVALEVKVSERTVGRVRDRARKNGEAA